MKGTSPSRSAREVAENGIEVPRWEEASAGSRLPFTEKCEQRSQLAVLGLAVNQVIVKAKTAEEMEPLWEERSLEARVVCLLIAGSSK
jgi:hypothetical protein